jgi:hypothetical protein
MSFLDRLRAACQAFVLTLASPDAFEDLDAPATDWGWAAMLLLHAEAVHGCEHTDQARIELGLFGARGQAAEGYEL